MSINIDPTPESFRENVSNITELRTLLWKNPVLIHALRVVRGGDPVRTSPYHQSIDTDAAKCNQSIGYHAALNNLMALAAVPEPDDETDEDFDLPPEEELEKQHHNTP